MPINPTRPVLRWHGGKWILAPWIISHFPSHRIYTEVYGGAASVLLRKPRSYSEVYNDMNGDVVNLFRVLQNADQAKELERLMRLTPFAREEFEKSYEIATDPMQRAKNLIILSFMGFGSVAVNRQKTTGFRANSARSGTTPAHDWRNYPESMAATIERLRGVVIENRPALEVLRQHDSVDTLHFVDPPYLHSTRKKGQMNNYTHEMTEADHRELAAALGAMGGGVVLSGYPSQIYEELYSGWHRVERPALADGARARTEVLWINEKAWAQSGRLL